MARRALTAASRMGGKPRGCGLAHSALGALEQGGFGRRLHASMRPTGHLPATLSASVLGFSFAHPRHLVYGEPNEHQLLRHGKTLSYYPGRLPVFCVKLRIIVVELRVIRIAAAVHEWCACKPLTTRKRCSLLRSLVYHWAQPRPFPCVLWKRRLLKHKSSLDRPHGLLQASGEQLHERRRTDAVMPPPNFS